jgi:hypothetical protein
VSNVVWVPLQVSIVAEPETVGVHAKTPSAALSAVPQEPAT